MIAKYETSSNGQLVFSASVVAQFRHANRALRWGQAFHQFMKLDRCTTDRSFCDRLYNETDEQKARDMVRSRTDHNQ